MNNHPLKILITGSSGQLGSELLRSLETQDHEFIGLDRKALDIKNHNEVRHLIRAEKPDILINSAAYTAVDNAESQIENSYEINCEAVRNLGEVCSEENVRVLHFSTDYVFDGSLDKAYGESSITAPVNMYGLTKLRGEQALIQSGCKCVIFRVSGLYSEFGKNFPKTIYRLLSKKEEVHIVNDQISSPTWAKPFSDFLVRRVINDKSVFNGEVFHYSEEGECSWYDIACEINKKFRKRVAEISSAEFKSAAQRPRYSKLDSSLVRSKFSIETDHWRNNLEEFLSIIENS